MNLAGIGRELIQMQRRFAAKERKETGSDPYILNQQVRLLDGRLKVESQVDELSTFTVTLPINWLALYLHEKAYGT